MKTFLIILIIISGFSATAKPAVDTMQQYDSINVYKDTVWNMAYVNISPFTDSQGHTINRLYLRAVDNLIDFAYIYWEFHGDILDDSGRVWHQPYNTGVMTISKTNYSQWQQTYQVFQWVADKPRLNKTITE